SRSFQRGDWFPTPQVPRKIVSSRPASPGRQK
ncbi:hypothetical protein KIPB_002369, partial [Kipferlia bialata]